MKKIALLIFILAKYSTNSFAGNGDSIFNMQYVHTLYVTFPYSNFYDSLLNTNNTDQYLKVNIDFNGEIFNDVGIKVKGNSSFNNPSQKKSFKLDFNEFIAGQDIHGLKKLNFNNSFKDPSFMREKLANDFLIKHQIPAPRTTYCNVYFNGQLWGLYTILEEVDDEFCKHWFSNNDSNLFKGDPHGDLRWKGSATQSLYETEYELKNNTSSNNWSDLISLIDVINNSSAANFESALEQKLNTTGFIKQWVVLNMLSSLDSYIGSGHNYYLYHDSISGKFQWIAWDNNEAFGSFKNGLSSLQLLNMDIYYLSNAIGKPLCNNMLANANYKLAYNNAYCELKQDFTNNYFDPEIDSIKNTIQNFVYNDPKKFYSNLQFDSSINYNTTLSGPGGITVFGLKSFINSRAATINTIFTNNNIICWPNEIVNIDDNIHSFCLYPNPTNITCILRANFQLKSLKLYDMKGQLLLFKDGLHSLEESLDTSDLLSGVYVLEINGHYRTKLIK